MDWTGLDWTERKERRKDTVFRSGFFLDERLKLLLREHGRQNESNSFLVGWFFCCGFAKER